MRITKLFFCLAATLTLLTASCAQREATKRYNESDFGKLQRATNDTSKNVVANRESVRKIRTLAEEADYKVMRALEFQ